MPRAFVKPSWATQSLVTNPTLWPQIMAEIELGNGLPDVRTTAETLESLKQAGFELLDAADLALTADIPWWDPVDPDSWRLESERGRGGRFGITGRFLCEGC